MAKKRKFELSAIEKECVLSQLPKGATSLALVDRYIDRRERSATFSYIIGDSKHTKFCYLDYKDISPACL